MQIFIPSRSRFHIESLTLSYIAPAGKPSAWPRDRIALVVPAKQLNSYSRWCVKHDVDVIACPKDGIAATRKFIGEKAHDKFIMLDDDLRFAHRPVLLPDGTPNDKPRLFTATVPQMNDMFSLVEKLLDRYVHVSIGARQGNQNIRFPLETNNRPLRALAYRKKPFLSCVHGRVTFMEDFDIALQLMKRGHKNAIITNYTQDQITTHAPGGCADYRDHASHEANALRMVELHAPFVTSRSKDNITGGEFGKRTEVTIYWKKLWKSVQREWL